MSTRWSERLAVCSWSLRPETPQKLIEDLKAIGIDNVQIALDPFRTRPQVWQKFLELVAQNGIRMISGMLATVGEDYTTMESIRRTGGIVPDETWDQNWKNIQEIAAIASKLGISLVTFHAGFLPHDPSDPGFAKLLKRLRDVADVFAAKNISLGLETGQETAQALGEFLTKLQRPNVGVNFDPANMILYEQGDPIEALRALAPWLRQVHIKDGNRTRMPGRWGDEGVVGTGEVDWKAFFKVLSDV